MKGNNNKKASRCSLGVAETVPRKPTREIALECLALYADDKLRQCLSLARSLIADYDHADAHAFAHVLLAFINESEPRLLADDHSPETDEIEDVHHILATKCNLASQEWMINLLELTCADTGSSVKVKALCHYFLYMVLCGNYGNFPFTNEEKSRIHLRQAAEGRDPRALTRMYCFKNIKYAASLGYCPAQRGLASMYLKGVEKEKVPVNVPEAMRLLRIAAEKGDQWAQYWLGDMVSNENPAEAVRLLKLSLAQGNIAARISLGLKYITDAVSTNQFRNMAEASRLILSCEPKFGRWVQGGTCAYNPEMWSSAFNLLAAVYSSGSVGIERNTRVALRLYHNAFVALKDKPIAAKCEIVTNVAQLYANGTGGCPKDERESQRWWKLVLFSAQGPPAAIVSISANSVDFLFPRASLSHVMKRFGGSGSEQVTTSSRGAVTGEWCRGIPKAELHAHLGGCVRLATLVELAADRGIDTSQASLHHHINSDGCNMTSVELESVYASCFRLFDIIHKAVDTTERVARVAAEAVSDFAADNVKYIELRTTPRELGARTKRDYIDGVLNSMSEACSASGVAADLVLSVSRDQDPVDAMSTVELAAEYFNNRDCGSGSHHASVVGVELSGNPYSRAWSEMAPSLDRARACGIPISLHFAEKESDSEALAMLSSRPNRVGHAVYVSRNSEVETQLLTQQVPVELCLTSNVATKRIPSAAHHSFASHVLGTEYQSHTLYPVAFCTDDPGVFCSSSSNEHLQAATAFGLTRSRVAQSSLHALEFSFALPAVKDKLRPLFHSSLNP